MSKRVLIPYRHLKKVKAYEEAARAGGMEPVAVCVSDSMPAGGFAGLLLTGGTDVNPALYGAVARPETDDPDDERDRVELEQIQAAMTRNLPILGICRGLQLLNVYHGGTLIQHIDGTAKHDPEKADHAGPAHEVRFEAGSRLAEIAGGMRWLVNSRHHQAVEKAGRGLRISARDSEDATVEGLERPDKHFVVAVQWHPEDQIIKHPEQLRLFQSFAAAL
ncbi:MAG TPA: gamma-glutamyl-gamma-aminobutyrate hydrolase family protein [Bryobacteraceae bacterium]|nr:gamma-glutamyl-gamma-aminobutyrate hydrolase family protein [Bryobacteraceae bacterium]